MQYLEAESIESRSLLEPLLVSLPGISFHFNQPDIALIQEEKTMGLSLLSFLEE